MEIILLDIVVINAICFTIFFIARYFIFYFKTERAIDRMRVKPTQEKSAKSFWFSRYLQDRLAAAGWSATPQNFLFHVCLQASVVAIAGVGLCFYIDSKIFLVIGVVGMFFLIFYRFLELNKDVERMMLKRRIQLPEYMIPLAILYETYTPHEAIKLSLANAGPTIYKDVKLFIDELEAYPNSKEPFRNFAKRIGIPEAYHFAVALEQSVNLSKEKTQGLLEQQIKIMQKMQEESYKRINLSTSEHMTIYHNIPLLNLVLIPTVMALVYIFEKFLKELL